MLFCDYWNWLGAFGKAFGEAYLANYVDLPLEFDLFLGLSFEFDLLLLLFIYLIFKDIHEADGYILIFLMKSDDSD